MIRIAILTAIACTMAGTASAQIASSTVLSNGSANCARAMARGERCIELETGHTSLFRLDKPFKVLFVGDPAIADAVTQDQYTFVLNAKQKEGRTNLIALDDATDVIFQASIIVTGPPDPLPVGRVRVAGKSGSAHDYWVYACTDTGCQRLKEEYPGERSKELFIPGLQQPPQINVSAPIYPSFEGGSRR